MKKVVFVDVDTQKDFMNADGKLYIPEAEDIKGNLCRLTEFALEKKIPIMATMDMHQDNDPEFEEFGEHCVIGTEGSDKIEETIGGKPGEDVFYYEKSTPSVFDIMKGDRKFKDKLRNLRPDVAVIYGVATDICVAAVVHGMQMTGSLENIKILLVDDATKGLNQDTIKELKERIVAKGGEVLSTDEVISKLSESN
jgi:nicotinamidase/pyrazinamidase